VGVHRNKKQSLWSEMGHNPKCRQILICLLLPGADISDKILGVPHRSLLGFVCMWMRDVVVSLRKNEGRQLRRPAQR